MARYIDADALKERLEDFSKWCRDGRKQGVDFVLDCPLPNMPTADVAPKSEVEWLEKENARLLNLSEYNRSAIEQDITDAKAEVAREIFEDIEKHECHGIAGQAVMYMIFAEEYAELKKKYTGEQNRRSDHET